MALLRWDEEEQKKEDGFFNPTPIKRIQSVQNSWQPTQATDEDGNAQQPQSDSYFLSEEKAQVDAQLRQRKQAEAAQRAEMARQAAIARQNEAINRENAERAQAAADAEARAASKYQGGEKPRNEGGFTGFLKDVGSGIQQGLSALGDIAIQGGSVIGSIGKNDQELVRHMEQSQKVRDWLYGFKDINGQNLRGTSGADESAGRVASGQGSIQDWAKVGGTGLQAGIDATMFMNPARLATMGLKPITTQSTSLLARTAASPAVRFAARDAAFFGSLQGTATFQNVYAETGDLEAATEAALTDMAIGGALQGTMDLAGSGINKVANRTFNSLRRSDKTPGRSPIDEVELTPIRDESAPVNAPTEDGNLSFQREGEAPVLTPADRPQFTPVADNLTPVRATIPEPLTEAPDQLNGQTPPDWDEVTAREVAAVREQPTPDEVPAVADGTARPPVVAPLANDMPTVRSEEVRALQEARAGTDQAQEAAINQRLQELDPDTPSVYRSEAEDRYGIGQAELGNGLYTGSKEVAGRRADGTISEEGLYEYKVNPEAKVLDSSSDEFRSLDSQASTHPSLKEPGISETEWRNRKTALLGQLVREAGYDGVKRGTNQFVGMSERALIPVTEGAPTYRSEPDTPVMRDDTLTDRSESEIADNIHIRELDNSLEAIRQRRAQLIADGLSPNYHGVKQLDKAADLIIREQEKIANSIRADLSARSESGVDRASTLERENPYTLVTNDGWRSYRDNSIKNYEERISALERAGGSKRHIEGLRQNLETLKSSKPNEVYRVNPKTGKTEVHPASELLNSFSKAMGEDVPPIVIGNVAEPGSASRLPANWAGANATYTSHMSRLDYKNKNSVYHETMHHIDHFIRGYEGKNPKIAELRKLRDEITLEDMRKFKAEDSRAKNKAEYIAHAMDSLLDGRIKAGQLGESVLKYINKFFTSVKEALSSSHVHGRVHNAELAEYVKRLDSVIHDTGKKPKQKPLSPGDLKPIRGNLPPKIQPKGKVIPVKAPAEPKPKKTVSEWAKRVYSQTDLHKDMKRRLAAALGKEKDAELPIGELLSGTKISAKDKAAITERYETLEKLSKEFNKLMQGNRKLFKADTPESIRQGISQLDEATSRKANKLIDAYGRAERDLNGYIRKAQGKQSLAHRGVNALQNVTGARNASLLSSVGGIERNTSQELGANLLDAVMHPVKYVKGVPQLVPEVLRSYKRAFREYTVKPKTISETLPYLIGNTYRVLMSPVTGQANYRKSVMRETLAESLLRAEGLDPTRAEIKKFAGSMGADSEVVANNLAGIMNGMTSHTNGLKVMKAYQKFIHTGSAEAKEAFMKNAERSSNLAAKLSRVGAESDNPKMRAAASLMNIVMPFVTTATNMAKTAATYNLNPMARSIPDEVMKAVRSNPANALSLLKANAVKGGVLAGVYGLYAAGVVQYNNGDEVDKPRGISIDLGNGEFFPVRGTPIEVPIAAVVAAGELSNDVADGKVREWQYYAGIISNSLPYIDSTNNIAAATISGLNAAFKGNADQGTGDNGYAFKSYGVNMAKSFVPYSNNGIEAGVNAWQGKSTNAKSTYDKDLGKWFGQSVRQAYDPAFRATLKDSRDASGRVRTVDQQGGFRIQKGINDELTKVHNDTIDNLVKYGRENGLGRGTQDMFNTYDTGKNNNFKSVQDTITFLDVEDGGAPDNAKKLEQNDKLADLAAQIRDGFWGDTSAELLTLNGQNLYSDVSVPNADGTKNSRLPLNMQSIKNAIAATDLPKEQRDRMYEISQANQALYSEVESGAMTYDQYKAVKAESEQEYVDILSNSESYQKLGALMKTLDEQGFFDVGGIGSTKSGQTYLWNSLNSLLGSKGATPAAQYPKSSNGWGSGGGGGRRGSGFGATNKPGNRADTGIKWTPVQARKMASVSQKKYTPFKVKVKLGNAVKKDKTQNYSDRSF